MFDSLPTSINTLKLLLKETPAAVALLDMDMCYVAYSDRWLEDYGIEKDSIKGESHYKYFPNLKKKWIEEHKQALQGKHIESSEQSFTDIEGNLVWMKRKYIPWRKNNNKIGGIIILNEVVTDLIKLEKYSKSQNRKLLKLENSERFQKLVFDNNPDYLFVKDADYKIVLANKNFLSMYPKNKRNKVIGYTTIEDYLPQEAEKFLEMDKKAFSEGISEVTETITFPDGEIRILETKKILFEGEDKDKYILGIAKDITNQQKLEKALLLEKEKAVVTLTSIGDAVITTDTEGRIEFINPVAEKLTGYRLENARNKALSDVFNIKDEINGEPINNPVERCLEQGRIIGLANHTILINRDGSEYAIEDSASPIRNKEGEILGVVLVFKDVTETRRMAREMSYQASHDHLTGLVNRREFERRLKRVIITAQEEGSKHATAYLDLDQFKVINDTCGHSAGDELLRNLSVIIQKTVRKRDTVGRLGGDEFGIIMEHCELDQAKRIVKKILKSINDYQFLWENKSFSLGASVGLVPITLASENYVSVLRSADAACYAAKEQGRNRMHVYHQNDEQLAKRHGEMQWLSKINDALENDNFILHGQLIRPSDGRKKHRIIEILLRMIDVNGTIIAPNKFLPAAERYGLSPKIDRWVIQSFMKWYSLNVKNIRDEYIWSINLSGLSIGDNEFQDFIFQQIDNYHVPAKSLCFEITETAAIANLSSAHKFFNTLQKTGCSVSLDDFGSGLSSFAYLKTLPIDYLKIDGVFIKDMINNEMDYAMVKSINEIGHVMGLQTIAEFVENDLIIKKLKSVKTDFVQGYSVHKPCNINDLLEL